jgi:hypothetical protein
VARSPDCPHNEEAQNGAFAMPGFNAIEFVTSVSAPLLSIGLPTEQSPWRATIAPSDLVQFSRGPFRADRVESSDLRRNRGHFGASCWRQQRQYGGSSIRQPGFLRQGISPPQILPLLSRTSGACRYAGMRSISSASPDAFGRAGHAVRWGHRATGSPVPSRIRCMAMLACQLIGGPLPSSPCVARSASRQDRSSPHLVGQRQGVEFGARFASGWGSTLPVAECDERSVVGIEPSLDQHIAQLNQWQ